MPPASHKARLRCNRALFAASVLFLAVSTPFSAAQPVQSEHLADHQYVLPEEYHETVLIDGTEYLVPPPWAGNRIEASPLSPESFGQIPVDFTHDGTKIYILTTALGPLLDLLHQAREDGIELRVESGYRSERYQRLIFKRMMAEGKTFADIVRYVAPPGYSQHMLGMAVDFHPSTWEFADTPAYAWLKENAQEFGFEEAYSQDNALHIPWEAWHWAYFGE